MACLLFWQRYLREGNQIQNVLKAYLYCLPSTADDPNFDQTPDFWSEKEIQKIPVPSVVQDILSIKEATKTLAEHYNLLNPDHPLSLEDLRQSCWIVQTRGFTTFKKAMDFGGREGLLSRVVLFPLIDLVNHGPKMDDTGSSCFSSNAALEVVETKAYDESFYSLVATDVIRKGQEIRICYGKGKETSIELLRICKIRLFPWQQWAQRRRVPTIYLGGDVVLE